VHLAENRVQVDAIRQGSAIYNVGDIGECIGYRDKITLFRGGDELAYFLLQQGDAELRQRLSDVNARKFPHGKIEHLMKLSDCSGCAEGFLRLLANITILPIERRRHRASSVARTAETGRLPLLRCGAPCE
jgi:hypothetical protein